MLLLLFLPLVKHWLVAELGASIQVSLHLCPGLVTYPPPQHPALVARGGREVRIVRWRHSAVKRIGRSFSCKPELWCLQKHYRRQAGPHHRASQGCLGRYWPLSIYHICLGDKQLLVRESSLPYIFSTCMSSWVLIVLPFQRPKCFPSRRADLSLYNQN